MPLLTGFGLLVIIAGGLLARDAVVVRDALIESQAQLVEVRSALGEADVETASELLRGADRSLGIARSRSRGPLWAAASGMPVLAEPVLVVQGVVDVSSAATAVLTAGVGEASDLVSGGLDIEVVDGRLDLTPITRAATVIDTLPVQQLRRATDALAAQEPGASPAVLVDARSQTLEFAEESLALLDRGDALLGALPGFLGTDVPRRYFLGVQTSAELRGTGGLIGFYAILEIDDGEFSFGTVEVLEGGEGAADEGDGALDGTVSALQGLADEGAVVTPAWFSTRYGHTGAASLFSNVNVDPDLPTTAPIALDLFRLRTGQRLDGMILIDPVGMQSILQAIGRSISVPSMLAQEERGLPEAIPAASFARFVTADIYEVYGSQRTDERKQLLAAIGVEAFATVFTGAWDGVAVGRAIADATGARHLQVFSTDEDEQAAFTAVGAAGAFAPTDTRPDRLAVTINNVVGGKQDVHLGHRIEVDLSLTAPQASGGSIVAGRNAVIRTTLVNPLTPTSHDEYVVGNCLVGDDVFRCFDGPAGWNRSWFSVWTPADDRLRAVRDADGVGAVAAGSAHGMRVFDRYQETPPQSEAWFEIEVEGPVTLVSDGDQVVYEWTFWRQAKATPDLLDVRITIPEGWRPVQVDLSGVGDTFGLLGVDAGAPAATARIDDQQVIMSGAVSRDTTVHVRLERE